MLLLLYRGLSGVCFLSFAVAVGYVVHRVQNKLSALGAMCPLVVRAVGLRARVDVCEMLAHWLGGSKDKLCLRSKC